MTEQEKQAKKSALWKAFFQEFDQVVKTTKRLEAIMSELRALKKA